MDDAWFDEIRTSLTILGTNFLSFIFQSYLSGCLHAARAVMLFVYSSSKRAVLITRRVP